MEQTKIKKKVWQIWYDPIVEDNYVIIKFENDFLDIVWDSYGIVISVPESQCEDDIYVRTISRLERELL